MKNLNQIWRALQANVPVLLTSSPGAGKTAVINALARQSDAHLTTLILSYMDPTDFGGLPLRPEKPGTGVSLEPPKWALDAKAAALDDQFTMIFIDELTTAPPAVQAPALRFVHEKVVGQEQLPDQVRIIAACNPPDQAAGGWSLEPPMANRFAHFAWKPDPDQWTQAIVAGFPDPELPKVPSDWEDYLPIKRSEVASFVKVQPDVLLKFPNDDSEASGPWPSLRSWDHASRLLAVSYDLNKSEQLKMVASCVGDGAAAEFAEWIEKMDLPDPRDILNDPKTLKLDTERPDRNYAILAGVTAVTAQDLEKYWVPCWEVLSGAAEQQAPDIAAALVVSLRNAADSHASLLPDIREHVRPFVPFLEKAGELD